MRSTRTGEGRPDQRIFERQGQALEQWTRAHRAQILPACFVLYKW